MDNATPIPSGKSRRGFFTCGKDTSIRERRDSKVINSEIMKWHMSTSFLSLVHSIQHYLERYRVLHPC